MTRRRRRKCRHCGQLYKPDPRNRWHQNYCSAPACQQASKRASYWRWAHSALGRRYARRPEHTRHVRDWRAAHPRYWKRRRKKPVALPDVLIPQSLVPSEDKPKLMGAPPTISVALPDELSSPASNCDALKPLALPDLLFLESPAWLGLIAQLTGVALPENIDAFTRRLILLGRQIQGQRVTPRKLSGADDEASALPSAPAQNAGAVQLDRPASGSG